jgi:transposase
VTDDIKRFTIICHLASGASNKEAADQAGVSLSTVERLKRDVDFKAELTDAISQIYRSSLVKLTLGMNRAAEELLRIVEASDTPARVRLEAIKILFSQTSNLSTLTLEDKMNRIEEQLKARTIQQPEDDEDDSPNYQLEPADRFR